MIVDVARLGEDSQEFVGEEPPEVFDLGDDPEVKPAGPIRYRITVSLAGNSLIADGVLESELIVTCVRCAEFFKFTIRDPAFSAVHEILNKDEAIDLTPDIRESMILAFPTNPVCSQDCKGLCPSCGTNLNKKRCRCAKTSKDDRWSVLNDLKVK